MNTHAEHNRFLLGMILGAFIAGIAFTGGMLFSPRHTGTSPVTLADLQTTQAQGNTQSDHHTRRMDRTP